MRLVATAEQALDIALVLAGTRLLGCEVNYENQGRKQNMQATTRRGLMASAAPIAVASIAGASVTQAAIPGRDTELVRLWDEYVAARHGLSEIEDDIVPEDQAGCNALEKRIWETPAFGLVGFAIKLRLIADYALGAGSVDRFILETVQAMERAAGLPHDHMVYTALPPWSDLRPPELRGSVMAATPAA